MTTDEVIAKISNLQPFITYLEETREDEWQVDVVRSVGNTKNCMFGHLVNWFYGKDYEGSVSQAWDWFEELWATTTVVYPVNDGQNPKYQQETPKQRVLAYLKDLYLGTEKTTWQHMDDYAKARGL